ncbi:Sugar phosphate isomerase/epimerase [Pseudonocardia thermophila]|uniref:Sugar phosphate isomerase/epimerase n=1 Tax=Pseudonocardia thermophila TaxID=1848 RepID=A0A1M6T8Q2_PSETH|nr:TIM barrel protein [Pseudonocardia thermophila]SHK53330.1 Sugar phosphate isomerase/epimerase [Pseudonocardia thermophila]
MIFSLSAATVLDLAPGDVPRCAADAGYPFCGVRFSDVAAQAPAVAAGLRSSGVELLDVEVVRLGPDGVTDEHRRLADAAAELGARFLLTVSQDPDLAATTDRVAAVADLLAGSTTRVAIEPMLFTGIRTRSDAERVARAVPGTVVLLDPLHLHRAGTPLSQPADPDLTGYAQLCDAAAEEPLDLAHEARHERLVPGEGVLALSEFLAALPPATPLSIEVQSDQLAAMLEPFPRAVLVREAAEKLL